MNFIKTTICALALTTGTAIAQDTTLTFFSWDPEQLEVEQDAIAAFEEANPGVKVEATAMPPKDYWPRLSRTGGIR